jgi:hypothetical protein
MSDLALLMITDGRKKEFIRTYASMLGHIGVDKFCRMVVVNDCLDPEYADWLESIIPIEADLWNIALVAGEKQGFSGAVQAGWHALSGHRGYIFHLEEDFTFPGVVPVDAMISILDYNPALAQVALKRNPVSGAEHAAGGQLERFRDSFDEAHAPIPHLIHKKWFTTNPCVYHTEILEIGWPDGPDSEAKFGSMIFDEGFSTAYFGLVDDDPRCIHIGHERTADWKP